MPETRAQLYRSLEVIAVKRQILVWSEEDSTHPVFTNKQAELLAASILDNLKGVV